MADLEREALMTLPRRSLLAGLGLTLAAPAIVRTPGLLMAVRPAKTLPVILVMENVRFITPDECRALVKQAMDRLDNRNRFAEYLHAEWRGCEQMKQAYPMIDEA